MLEKKYLIKKGSMYVARPGSRGSYTDKIVDAQRFSSYEDACENMCPGNERVTTVEEEFGEQN